MKNFVQFMETEKKSIELNRSEMNSNLDINVKEEHDSENHIYSDEYILEHKKQIMKAMKEEMYEYYKKNHNLNLYYYQNDDAEYRRKLDKWSKKFFDRISAGQEKKNSMEDEKEETHNLKTLTGQKTLMSKLKKKANDDVTRKQSDNVTMAFKEKKTKFNIERDCLDMDDLIQVDLPVDYNEDKHEEIMRQLGEELLESRRKFMIYTNYAIYSKTINANSNLNTQPVNNIIPGLGAVNERNKSELHMKNDDYNLLLALMRNKKREVFEKKSYYPDYKITLEDVYRNEKDIKKGTEEKEKNVYENVENFVKNFLEVDIY